MLIKPENPERLIDFLSEKPLVLYGMGILGKAIAQWCDANRITYVFADRDAREKQKMTAKTIIAPEALRHGYVDANIVVSSNLYFNEIAGQLRNNGFGEEQILSYRLFLPERIVWADLEDNIDWELMKPSVELLAKWLSDGIESLADYGAGQMYLKGFLCPDIKYYPIDYFKRYDETIVSDLNTGEFPDLYTDAAVCNGVLEFLTTSEELLAHICERTSRVIVVSYMTLDKFPDINGRRASGYISDLAEQDILDMLCRGGFRLIRKATDPLDATDTIYLFEKY